MKTTYVILDPENPVGPAIEVDFPKEPGYRAIKEVLDPLFPGASWEHVFVHGEEPGTQVSMFVDDTGRLKNLPLNPYASGFLYPGAIAGRAVLFNRRIWY